MNIKIKKHFLLYKDYKLKCSIGKSGITNFKKEGDLATPKGTFNLGFLYYRKDKVKLPKCKLSKKIIKKNMGWCDDYKSKKYNQEIKFPFPYSAEKLYRKSQIYDLLINIKFNSNPILKKKVVQFFYIYLKKNIIQQKDVLQFQKKIF